MPLPDRTKPAPPTADNQSPADKNSPAATKERTGTNAALGNSSSEEATIILREETLLAQLGGGQQRPPAQRGNNGETAAEAANRRRLELQEQEAGRQQQNAQIMKNQVDAAVGKNAPDRIKSFATQKFSDRPVIIGKPLAEVRGAIDFLQKDYYPATQPPRSQPDLLSAWKESEIARTGRALKSAVSLWKGGQETEAENALASVKADLNTWGQPIPPPVVDPNGNVDKTAYWSAVERKLVTLETVMDGNADLNNNFGNRYFQDLWGALQADSRATAPKDYNKFRNYYLGTMETLVSSPTVLWSPLLAQAPAEAEHQRLQNIRNRVKGDSHAALTASNLLMAVDAYDMKDMNESKRLIEETTAAGQRYAQWTASVIDSNNKINRSELINKIYTLDAVAFAPRNGKITDQTLNRYVTADLLRIMETRLKMESVPVEEAIFSNALCNHIVNAQSLQQTIEKPFPTNPRTDQIYRQGIIKDRLIPAEARTFLFRNGLQGQVDQKKLTTEINKLVDGVK